ncbi:hypothetical protein PspLS_10272 [Pyricularia sp. CBS 133598]|nr:hypothetical protein PspLS_10272 [Pyricularia sp. CBS 133598]
MRLDATSFTFAFIAAQLGGAAAKGCPYYVTRGGQEIRWTWSVIEAGTSVTLAIDGYPVTISASKDCVLKQSGLPRWAYKVVRGESQPLPVKSGSTAQGKK